MALNANMLDAVAIYYYNIDYNKDKIMKKNTAKISTLTEMKKRYHQEIIVKPAKRLLEALLKAEEKELSVLLKTRKASTSSR